MTSFLEGMRSDTETVLDADTTVSPQTYPQIHRMRASALVFLFCMLSGAPPVINFDPSSLVARKLMIRVTELFSPQFVPKSIFQNMTHLIEIY